MNILAKILSSKVRAEIFRILFGIKNPKLHLREIQRSSGFAISTVNQEAKKLSKLGLIKERKSGNRVYYRANINHPLYREIHNMVIKTIGLCDLFKEVLVDKPVIIAFIFGSTAEGKEKPESDIDLFIIGDIDLRNLSALLKEPGLKIDREINPHIMTVNEFIKRRNGKDHFITHILESSKIFIIGSENDFRKLG